MKLVTFEFAGKQGIGVLKEDGILPAETCGILYEDMNALITNISEAEMEQLRQRAAEEKTRIPAEDARLLSPIVCPKQDVICLGLNYHEHVLEASDYSKGDFDLQKEKAVYFSKRCTKAAGCGDEISCYPELTQKMDYEAELAVVIGRDAFRVREEEAASYIFGYTVLNDLTARDIQHGHSQWYFGKSLDGFTAMGPCIVTADEIAFPPALPISCTVNGEVRQASDTSLLIHGIAVVISELSQGMTLAAGTIIATGTPKGTGMGLKPPVFLKKGDRVACTIGGIGTLENVIV